MLPALTFVILVAMVAISAWVARELPEGPVPVHFDVRGNADRLGSRWVVLSMLPLSYLALTVAIVAIGAAAPEGEVNRDEILIGHGIASLTLLAAHAFIAWLMLRWARMQSR